MISIYVITNTVNNKRYVGQTIQSIEERFASHKRRGYHRCPKLHNALNKYGRENFRVSHVSDAYTQKEADVLEVHFIAKFDTINNGYNLATGGSHGKLHETTKKKLSVALRGNTNGTGVCHSPEGLARMVAAKVGKKRPDMIGNQFSKGLKDSQEVRMRKSEAQKARWAKIKGRVAA